MSGNAKLMKAVKGEAKLLKSAQTRMNVATMIKTEPRCVVSATELDTNSKLLGTPAGTVDLVTGMLHEPKRSDLITKQTVCSPEDGVPVIWMFFLAKIFNNNFEMMRFIQTLCGYLLTGLTDEEKLFFCYGTGANGKSKLLETIYYILGDYAQRAPASLLLERRTTEHPTALAGLQGARGVFASEVPSGHCWNDQVIKDLTGGDTVTARLMRQDFFEFKPKFKLVVAGNHQPRLKNVDESMVRRMVMVPFDVTILPHERNAQLGEKLKKEASQILSWMIKGAVRYLSKGLFIPEKIAATSAEYIKNEDVIGEFLEEALRASGDKIEVNLIFKNYLSWIASKGYNYPITETQFRKELKDRSYTVKRSNSKWYIHNVAINLFHGAN